MPRVAQYQAAELAGFPKGLNLHADSSRLEAQELAVALNVRLGARGEVQLRTGYTRFDSGFTDSVSFIYPWRTFDGINHLIVTGEIARSIYSSVGGSNDFVNSGFDVGSQGTLQSFGVGFAGAAKKVYVSSKHQTNVRSFDGTDWLTVATMPNVKMLWYRHGRMFAINDIERPSGVYFSELLDPETFATDDYIEVSPDDGFEINASTIFGDDLVLFKDNAVWKMSGRTPSSFSLYEVDSHRGCVSPQGHAQLRGRLFFFDRDTGIWAFDGAGFELVSQPINDYILKNQNYELAWKASMYDADDRIYVSIPWQGGGYHSFVYFGDTGAWTEYDTGFLGATGYLDNRYLGLPDVHGVYYADEASHVVPPSVQPINGVFRTGWTLIGGAGVKARIRRLEMTVKGEVTTGVTLRMYADFNAVTPMVERSFDGGPAPASLDASERRVALDGWGTRLHAVAFEFETDDWPFQLNDLTVFYTGGTDLRGER